MAMAPPRPERPVNLPLPIPPVRAEIPVADPPDFQWDHGFDVGQAPLPENAEFPVPARAENAPELPPRNVVLPRPMLPNRPRGIPNVNRRRMNADLVRPIRLTRTDALRAARTVMPPRGNVMQPPVRGRPPLMQGNRGRASRTIPRVGDTNVTVGIQRNPQRTRNVPAPSTRSYLPRDAKRPDINYKE